MDIIYSHGSCPDGFVAAMIAKRRYPEAEVIFLDHGADHTENLKKAEGKDVLMLDFSLRTREENDALAASAKLLRILDHHKSAREVLEGAPYAIFDMKRSGAGLAWDYLFGKDSPTCLNTQEQKEYLEAANSSWSYFSDARPWYVDYTEARDLWKWESFPNSRAVCAYLGTLPFEFGEWQHLDHMDVTQAAQLGQGAKAHIDHYVREAVKQGQYGILDGNSVEVLNVCYLNCSEVGNELCKDPRVQYSMTWFERGDGMIQFSLRSIGDFDVSEVAKKYGGGGHRNAAGFQVSLAEGRRLVDVILGREVEPVTLDVLSGKCVK
jgi:oligoribonuclease NrnB/cAMP/cGMP phosphodiesterase (DHH superfamily)